MTRMEGAPVADLHAETPFATLKPVQIGPWVLTEPAPEPVHAILPLPGAHEAASDALCAVTGLGLPGPGQSVESPHLRCLWAGRDQILAVGALPPGAIPPDCAMVTELSDGWARLRLAGPGWEDVLARGTPLDLRPSAFAVHATARTEWHHMAVLLVRLSSAVELWVMRSYAETALAHLRRDMTQRAARHRVSPPQGR